MDTIILNLGHAKRGTVGASGFINEVIENRRIGYIIKAYLEGLGYKVIVIDHDYVASQKEELNMAINEANQYPNAFLVSLHFNAGGGNGVEIFTYNAANLEQATRVVNNMKSIGSPLRSPSIKNGNQLGIIAKTKPKAMLIEIAFVDNKTNVDFYNNNVDQIARAISEGITNKKIEGKKVYKMENLVCYGNQVDKRAAEYLADHLKCPCMDANLPFAYEGVAENLIAVGGGSNFSSYTTLELKGNDRYDTLKTVLKYMGKL